MVPHHLDRFFELDRDCERRQPVLTERPSALLQHPHEVVDADLQGWKKKDSLEIILLKAERIGLSFKLVHGSQFSCKQARYIFLKVPRPGGEPGIFLVFHLFSLSKAAP